jgi:hypothetical protein
VTKREIDWRNGAYGGDLHHFEAQPAAERKMPSPKMEGSASPCLNRSLRRISPPQFFL